MLEVKLMEDVVNKNAYPSRRKVDYSDIKTKYQRLGFFYEKTQKIKQKQRPSEEEKIL